MSGPDVEQTAGPAADQRDDLRTFLRANMLDGDESGLVTYTASDLLTDVCDLVAQWLSGEAIGDERLTTVSVAALVAAAEERGAAKERERCELRLRDLADRAKESVNPELAADLRWAANRMAEELGGKS